MTSCKKYGETNSKLRDLLKPVEKFLIDKHEELYIFYCSQCGEGIEHVNNIVIYESELYHLKCMSSCYESEKTARDY
tara:strand:+ start:291 stop:521 length:231 start_codon:yes stop_codon:yes gene_type:complete